MLLLNSLAKDSQRRILLVVLDGLGGVPRENKTELEAAWTPNLNRLAASSSLGLLIPVRVGITPGSGPAHMGLFGYDPLETTVGRGVVEALGVGLDLESGDVCARGNYAQVGPDGRLLDRRAGRLSTEESTRLCGLLQSGVPQIEDVGVRAEPGIEHRFVVRFRGEGLSPELTDSDPQKDGEKPLPVRAGRTVAEKSARVANEYIRLCAEVLKKESSANHVLLRGFGCLPQLATLQAKHGIKAACVAAYPMYRGLARLVGMQIIENGGSWSKEVEALRNHVREFDFFFLHFKETDKAGEDGDFDAKMELIERFDEDVLPELLKMEFEVLCITGDHSTPAVLRGHSWHSVPLLLHSEYARPQVQIDEFGERACARGNMGYVESKNLMGLLLAHALKLGKFGA